MKPVTLEFNIHVTAHMGGYETEAIECNSDSEIFADELTKILLCAQVDEAEIEDVGYDLCVSLYENGARTEQVFELASLFNLMPETIDSLRDYIYNVVEE